MPDGCSAKEEELRELKQMPFIAMVASVGSNDEPEMYNYLGGVRNSKRSEELDAAFKQDKSNFHIAIVVDMWITGFDVPSLTYMYNDKPLKKHLLIQTISRVNRKHPGKDYGFIVDYIGIRDNMREAMKIYGGDNSIAPTADDVQQATDVFREELSILKDLFAGYDLAPFLDPAGDPALRYRLLPPTPSPAVWMPKRSQEFWGIRKPRSRWTHTPMSLVICTGGHRRSWAGSWKNSW